MPPWLQQLMQENKGMNKPYDQQVSPVVTPSNPSGIGTGGTTSTTTNPISGGDFLDVFAQALTKHLQSQDQLAPQRQQTTNDLLFGRKLGMSGAPIAGAEQGSGNPWATATWESPQARYDQMANGTGLAYGPTKPGLASRQRNVRAQGAYVPQRF